MARPGRYLFQRAGSQNWHLRLQYPSEAMRSAAVTLLGREVPAKVERSLGTPDRRQAEVLAGPEILEHKRFLLAFNALMKRGSQQGLGSEDKAVIEAAYWSMLQRNPIVSIPPEPLHPPGKTVHNGDGTMIIPTAKDLIHLDAAGNQIKTTPNVKPGQIGFKVEPTIEPPAAFWRAKTVKSADVDTEIVETWITERNPAKTHANAARNMLALFKKLHPTKTFATADRDDARAMVVKLVELGNVSATVKSKLSGLVAAVNLEMSQKKPRVKFNPFSGVAKKKKEDTTKRLSLTEKDVAVIEARRDLFTDEQWLMWRFCINTGARPAEIYTLQEEHRETLEHHPITQEKSDIRYIWIDRSKTAASTRRISIPSAVLPLLPAEIKGPMFTEDLGELCRLINVAMQKAGVTSPDPTTGRERKVFYSARHRCKSRLRDASCPDDIRRAIMGHTRDEHDDYGDETPLWQIKPWIEYLNHQTKKPPTVVEALAVE